MKTNKQTIIDMSGDFFLSSWHYENFDAFLIDIGEVNPVYMVLLDDNLLFKGGDFKPSPLASHRDPQTMNDLLGFITCQPGDTDDEYFANYNSEQLIFAKSYFCVQLSGIVSDFNNPEYEDEFLANFKSYSN